MRNFYKGKKVLVTGSTGFKGSWLSFWLHDMWAEVIGYALPAYDGPNNFDALKLDSKITQIIGDIRNIEELEKTIDQYRPEIVFHLAAQPLVRESYAQPVYTMEANVMWTVNVLEMVRKKDFLTGWVFITTDKVYENKESMEPYKETDRLWWFDPYSASKAMCELVISSYVKSFFKTDKKIASVRAGNVIGGGDWWKDRLIPDVVRSIMKDEVLTLRNPDAVRPRQYMLEALYGYLLMGKKIYEDDKYLGAYNFWPDISDNLKVVDVVENAIKILGKWSYQIIPDPSMHEAWLLLLDNTKAKTLLWWKPKYQVAEVLKRTLDYYKTYYEGWDIEKLATEEVRAFDLGK